MVRGLSSGSVCFLYGVYHRLRASYRLVPPISSGVVLTRYQRVFMNFDKSGFLVWLIRRFKSSGKGRGAGLFVFRRVDLVFQTVQRRSPEEVTDLDPIVYAVV